MQYQTDGIACKQKLLCVLFVLSQLIGLIAVQFLLFS